MLSYVLAITIGIISLSLFLNAFISPKIHRKDDFLWSGLGLFYALILWVCAGRITGAVLLGQIAAVSVIISFIWENRKLRQSIISQENNVTLEGFSVLDFILNLISKLPVLSDKKIIPPPSSQTEIKTDSNEKITETTESKNIETEIKETVKEKENGEIIDTSKSLSSTPPKEELKTGEENIIESPDSLEFETLKEEQNIPIQEVKKESEKSPSDTSKKDDKIMSKSLVNEDEKLDGEKKKDNSSSWETDDNLESKIDQSETEKKGLLSKLFASLGGLTNLFNKKDSTSSEDTNIQGVAKKDQDDSLTLEDSENEKEMESKLDSSSQENNETIDNLDLEKSDIQETIETEVESEIKEDEITENEILEKVDSEEIKENDDLNEDEKENQILDTIEEESNWDLESTDEAENLIDLSSESEQEMDLELEEIDIKSDDSVSEKEDELELSNDVDSEDDLDVFSEEIEIEETLSTEEEMSLNVPEEDKIDLLTDLTGDEDKETSLDDEMDELDELLTESESLEKNNQESIKKENESSEKGEINVNELDDILSDLPKEESK